MAEPTIKPSVLDRLTGSDRRWDGARPQSWNESLDLAKRSVLRDLQWILNTRQISEPVGEPYELLSQSVFNFGLPDITSLSADSSETPARLRRFIQDAIETFEPRLTDVRVTLSSSGNSKDRRVQFLIEADLRVDPDPQRVQFDTVLDVSSGKFAVSSHRDADD
ncbi:MAG: type VI secretion system baseplate subunit TssE [Gemmatimonadota bacterium]